MDYRGWSSSYKTEVMGSLKYVLLISVLAMSVAGCKKEKNAGGPGNGEEPAKNELYLVKLPGDMIGAGNKYYKIVDGTVIADLERKHDNDPSVYDDTLSGNNAAMAMAVQNIPREMYNENGKHYHDPMLVDCGGFKVAAIIKGTTFNWSFSGCTQNLPKYAQEYVTILDSACRAFEQ